jgi:hypothetical protein
MNAVQEAFLGCRCQDEELWVEYRNDGRVKSATCGYAGGLMPKEIDGDDCFECDYTETHPEELKERLAEEAAHKAAVIEREEQDKEELARAYRNGD